MACADIRRSTSVAPFAMQSQLSGHLSQSPMFLYPATAVTGSTTHSGSCRTSQREHLIERSLIRNQIGLHQLPPGFPQSPRRQRQQHRRPSRPSSRKAPRHPPPSPAADTRPAPRITPTNLLLADQPVIHPTELFRHRRNRSRTNTRFSIISFSSGCPGHHVQDHLSASVELAHVPDDLLL